ncbi:ribonuclease H2, subunit B [Scheffersomyces coipomensis]|uniref:ribonuclease H2, subunit B n=1 Tax=Scheffersomyces coipomensis TaxID=1788519 RepID=UPI00315D2601
MLIDNSSRIILFPNEAQDQNQSFKVIRLPIAKNLSETKPYLLTDDNIYELNEIKGVNPYDGNKENLPFLKNGDPVKSYIFENGDEQGGILQSSSLIVSNKFNVIYLLLSIILKYESSFTKNYITIHDFIDKVSSLFPDIPFESIPIRLYTNALLLISEEIEENDEFFYKFDKSKALEYINNKVKALHEYISNDKSSTSIVTHLKGKLFDHNNALPIQNIINLLSLHYAIDFIIDSYLNDEKDQFKQTLIDQFKYDFKPLNDYLQTLSSNQKNLKVIEDNLQSIVQSTHNASTNTKKPATTAASKKKPVKKVAIGKGALDGFFKRAS